MESLVSKFKQKLPKFQLNLNKSKTRSQLENQQESHTDYAFLVKETKKIFIMMCYSHEKDETIFLQNEQVIKVIPTKALLEITLSGHQQGICQLTYHEKDRKKQCLLEMFSLDRYLECVLQSQHFGLSCIKQVKQFSIESLESFALSSFSFLCQKRMGGILKVWCDSLFQSWTYQFFALFDDFLIMRKVPDIIHYEQFRLMEGIKFFDIRRVHWFDSRSQGMSIFSLHFKDGQKDLFAVSPSLYHIDGLISHFDVSADDSSLTKSTVTINSTSK